MYYVPLAELSHCFCFYVLAIVRVDLVPTPSALSSLSEREFPISHKFVSEKFRISFVLLAYSVFHMRMIREVVTMTLTLKFNTVFSPSKKAPRLAEKG